MGRGGVIPRLVFDFTKSNLTRKTIDKKKKSLGKEK